MKLRPLLYLFLSSIISLLISISLIYYDTIISINKFEEYKNQFTKQNVFIVSVEINEFIECEVYNCVCSLYEINVIRNPIILSKMMCSKEIKLENFNDEIYKSVCFENFCELNNTIAFNICVKECKSIIELEYIIIYNNKLYTLQKRFNNTKEDIINLTNYIIDKNLIFKKKDKVYKFIPNKDFSNKFLIKFCKILTIMSIIVLIYSIVHIKKTFRS